MSPEADRSTGLQTRGAQRNPSRHRGYAHAASGNAHGAGEPCYAQRSRPSLPWLLLPLACVLLLAGCANYQLGTGSTPNFRTLYIEPVRVDALVPQTQVVVGTQLRETFLRDSRVQLVGSAESADAVLSIVLDRYERAVATVRPDDTGLARRFDVELAGRATLTDRRTGKAIFENRPLVARRGVFSDSGLVPAEYQNLSVLAQDLARQAQQAVLDTW